MTGPEKTAALIRLATEVKRLIQIDGEELRHIRRGEFFITDGGRLYVWLKGESTGRILDPFTVLTDAAGLMGDIKKWRMTKHEHGFEVLIPIGNYAWRSGGVHPTEEEARTYAVLAALGPEKK